MPHVLVSEEPGSSLIRASRVRNAFGGQVMGLDGKATPADVGKQVASKEHQIGVALVDQERDLGSVMRSVSGLSSGIGVSKDRPSAFAIAVHRRRQPKRRRETEPPPRTTNAEGTARPCTHDTITGCRDSLSPQS